MGEVSLQDSVMREQGVAEVAIFQREGGDSCA